MRAHRRWFVGLVIVATIATLLVSEERGAVAATPTTAGGVVGAFGSNMSGQLGDSSNTNATVAVQSGVPDAIDVKAGGIASYALRPDGTVWAWGANAQGELGDNTTVGRSAPAPVPGLTDVTAIAAGDRHVLARKADGTVWAWGLNNQGQLGDNTTTNRLTPVQVQGITTATAIGAGYSHSLARLQNGSVVAWGANNSGQLGDNSTTNRPTPVTVVGISDATAVAGGVNHSIALSAGGAVYAWGTNMNGQLGDGTTTPRSTAAPVPGLTGVTAIASGWNFTIALRTDGTPRTWGHNGTGQIGNGASLTSQLTPVQPTGVNGLTAVAAGSSHALALKSDGTLQGWGSNGNGELGDGTTTNRLTAVAVAVLTGVTGMAGGYEHSLVITTPAVLRVVTDPPLPSQISIDGRIADTYGVSYMKLLPGAHTVSFSHVEGWTEPAPIATGTLVGGSTTEVTGTFVQRGYLRVITSPAVPSTIWVDGTPRSEWGLWTDMPVGDHTVCFGSVEGKVRPDTCRGTSVFAGQLSTVTGNFEEDSSGPSSVVGAWGLNADGQIGDDSNVSRLAAVQSVLPDAVAVAAGLSHSVALRADGTVWTWGLGSSGQLGHNSFGSRDTPVWVTSNAIAIAAGANSSYALKGDGTVESWGANANGQLGNNSTTNRNFQVQVSGLTDVVAIAAGANHALALLSNGTVRAWGSNLYGQLGDNTQVDRDTPVTVSGLTGVTKIAGGAGHSLAVKTDGTAMSWGANTNGQLGDNTTTGPRLVPGAVSSLTGAADVKAGQEHSVVLKSNGTVMAWGGNSTGQLGDGTTSQRNLPTAVPGLSSIAAIGTNTRATVALRSNGTLAAWGQNNFGQLGDGTTTNRTSPTNVLHLSGVTALAVGGAHTVVLATPATLRVVSSPAVPTQISVDGNIADTYGVSYMKLLPTQHTVSFTSVAGFDPVAPITQILPGGVVTTLTGTFVPRGYLRVMTSPAVPATIWIDGYPRADWGTWTDHPVGNHTVCFGSVANLNTPACQTVNLTAAGATVTGNYT